MMRVLILRGGLMKKYYALGRNFKLLGISYFNGKAYYKGIAEPYTDVIISEDKLARIV